MKSQSALFHMVQNMDRARVEKMVAHITTACDGASTGETFIACVAVILGTIDMAAMQLALSDADKAAADAQAIGAFIDAVRSYREAGGEPVFTGRGGMA